MKIAICDDDLTQSNYLAALIKKWAGQNGCPAATEIYDRAEAFLFAWSGDRSFDMLLLDIQMPGQNGMELARTIRQTDERIPIFFITGFSDFMDEGYEVSALHYLLKPVNESKLFQCLDKAYKQQKTEVKTLLVEIDGGSLRIRQDDILYLEAFAHSVTIQTVQQCYEAKSSISEFEKSIDGHLFIRTHRSYIVGLKYIQKIGKTELTLDNGATVPVSRRLYNEVNSAFISFYRGEK